MDAREGDEQDGLNDDQVEEARANADADDERPDAGSGEGGRGGESDLAGLEGERREGGRDESDSTLDRERREGERRHGERRGGERLDGELEAERESEREFEEDDEEDDGTLESVTIEISGLSIYTHHGVSSAEREVGQRLVLDLRLEIGESDATATDRIEDTVDYAEVCQLVTLVAQQRSHRTLERLCSSIADRLIVDYELEGVWVKAAKPEPPIPLPVEEVSVEVWREPGE